MLRSIIENILRGGLHRRKRSSWDYNYTILYGTHRRILCMQCESTNTHKYILIINTSTCNSYTHFMEMLKSLNGKNKAIYSYMIKITNLETRVVSYRQQYS